MTLVHCRGCGKPIHETAPTCPGCGAPQQLPAVAASARTSTLAVVGVTLAAVGLAIAVLADGPFSRDELTGCAMFAVAAGICGAISLAQKRLGRTAAIVCLVLAVMTLLVCIGNL